MDILAHGLWSFAVFHKKKYVWLAVLFGLLPDFTSFGILFAINLLNGSLQRGRPSLDALPTWIFASYNMTHSIVVFAFIFLLIYLIFKKWYWPFIAWGLHILIDIPTHSNSFFPTPFLWPMSNYKFNGISWATPWFMILNYGSLLIVFLVIAHNKAKKKKDAYSKRNKSIK